jgi:carboxynorspermidine decarboxylase
VEHRQRAQAARRVLKTPAFVVDERAILRNLRVLARVREQAGCKVFLALKAFAMPAVFPLLRRHLDGACASGPFEARLAAEELTRGRRGCEVHTFSPAFRAEEFPAVLRHSTTVVFNSFAQLDRFAPAARRARVQVGLRVNPGWSGNPHPMYDPCSPSSGLGIPASHLLGRDLAGVDGLHFHVLCEQGAEDLARVLAHFTRRFGRFLPGMKWVNFGGGHWITKPGYNVALLVRLIRDFRRRYGVQVHLEPGEAVAIHTGVLVATVLDVDMKGVAPGGMMAVLDASAAAHMPDTLEMPYDPDILGAEVARPRALLRNRHLYTLRGNTCLAGDRIGRFPYAFSRPLAVGDRIVLDDMSHYTMVKTNTFNGVPLPAIYRIDLKGRLRMVKQFGYQDFRGRLS